MTAEAKKQSQGMDVVNLIPKVATRFGMGLALAVFTAVAALAGDISARAVVQTSAAHASSKSGFRDAWASYGNDLRDRCWMFGHDSGQHDGPGNANNIPLSPKVSMGEACRYMGVSNVVVCVWHYPGLEYLEQFKGLRRVVWAVDNGYIKRHTPVDDYPKRFAAAIERTRKMDNLIGFEFDDFFNGHKETGYRIDYLADGTAVETLTGSRTLAELREASRRIHALSPAMDMRLVLYTEELVYGKALKPIIDCFDTVSLWTWHSDNISELPVKFDEYRRLVGQHKQTFLGLYMWDFADGRPIGRDRMRMQLEMALGLFRRGMVDGFLFHCTPLVNKNLPEVEMARTWIAEHGSEPIGRR